MNGIAILIAVVFALLAGFLSVQGVRAIIIYSSVTYERAFLDI